ncbi:MAG: hypothetical protein MJ210_00460 [Alphaproteobacteria bacterium]|nr:hypothetical protein [Alphaproteobacteria bacterium]
MKNGKILFFTVVLLAMGFLSEALAKSVVKGDPELLWRSPLGKEDISNTAKNRCLLIKKIAPGATKATETTENIYELLSEYTSNLYAQSIMITAYLEEETEDEKKLSLPKANDEISIIKKKITRRLEDIARRLNIINSLDAGTSVVSSLFYMVGQSNNVYNDIDCDEL